MKRLLWIGLAAVVAIGVGAPYLNADIFRPAIERALERGLGRQVEIGGVYFNILTGPGFTLEDVTIHEDARAGIEPFAYVPEADARVRLWSLFSRHLDFSSLRLGKDTIVNLVKTANGKWNFQFLLTSAPAISGRMPEIKMRGGRVNFKFEDTKSVFYFNEADFDLTPSSDGSVDLRFSGAPSRTDRAAQPFGLFFVRSNWKGQRVNMKVELEKSNLEEIARLIDRKDFGLHGIVAFQAQLSGSPSDLAMTGELEIDDIHRWDLLPKHGGGWRIPYKGTLDLRDERLEIASAFEAGASPLSLQFRAWDLLSTPHWDAEAGLKQAPLAALIEVARHLGNSIPENLVADGSVSGAIRYDEENSFAGQAALENASLTLPEGQPLRVPSAAVSIDHGSIALAPSTFQLGDAESAEVEGGFDSQNGLNLKMTTRGLSIADLHSYGVSGIPLLERTNQGTMRGWAKYEWTPGQPGEWSGEYDVQNARVAIEGIADPVRIQSASIVSNGARLNVTKLHARAGEIAFTGDYRYEPGAVRPHKFHLEIPKADGGEIERLLAPALVRERGFIARALRLGAPPAPEWLKKRRADGMLTLNSLAVGDTEVHVDSARLLWDGSLVRLVSVNARIDPATFEGELAADLSGRAPHFHLDGKLEDVAYRGGQIDFEGTLDADGLDAGALSSSRAQGCLHARSITFAPDVDFRAVKGCFEMAASPSGLRWKLPGIEVQQGGDSLYGTGATLADGRLVLDLTNRDRAVRYQSAPAAQSPQ
ncbi:MAG TPA: hypothetical protein VKS01_06655 [Bryobacteraceae bacterium]|nr:hypothetical protein [Bryobacteraceae bacterium]